MENQIETTKKYIDDKFRQIEERYGVGDFLYLDMDDLKVISKALEMYLDFTNGQREATIMMGLTSDKKGK